MSEFTLHVTDRAGSTRQLPCATGDILMQLLRDNVDDNVGVCGGEISCGTCLVTLGAKWFNTLKTASEDEQDMLDALAAPQHARLGCQLILDEAADGMHVTLLQED